MIFYLEILQLNSKDSIASVNSGRGVLLLTPASPIIASVSQWSLNGQWARCICLYSHPAGVVFKLWAQAMIRFRARSEIGKSQQLRLYSAGRQPKTINYDMNKEGQKGDP